MSDLSTLLAELDAKVAQMTKPPWCTFVRDIEQMSDGGKGYPLNVYPDCATVHVGHPTVDDERTGNVGLRRQEDIDGIVAIVNAYPTLREGIAQLQREKATDAWHTGWQVAVRERDEARRECDQWREKWNATLDREARRNAEILQLKAANNEMREVLLTLSTADPKLLAEQPEMTAGIARMALQLANHWAAKGSVDAA